jgi:glycine cleavage system H protein
MYPADRTYSKDHEWFMPSDGEGTVGITDYAQQQLGDIVYVELPDVGRRLSQGEVFGTIESVKAVSELYSPMSGEIVAVNTDLPQHPEQVNQAPHETWMIRLRITQPDEAAQLLTREQYEALLASP